MRRVFNKKNLASVSCFMAIIMNITGCQSTPSSMLNPEDSSITYEEIYGEKRTTPYPLVLDGAPNKAVYGYFQSHEQGYNQWYYRYRKGNVEADLPLKNNRWQLGKAFMDGPKMHPDDQVTLIREFHTLVSGQAFLYGTLRQYSEGPGASLAIYLNGVLAQDYSLSANDQVGIFVDLTLNLVRGDLVSFAVFGDGANVYFNPTISYTTDSNTTLYPLDRGGHYYGDMFFYYDPTEKALYDWYLWNLDAMHRPYNFEFEKTTDMFAWSEPSAQDILRVENAHYLNHIYDPQTFNDYTLYPLGVRDNFIYKDEKNQRMVMVAQSVRSFGGGAMDTDLTLRISSDINGFEWPNPPVVIDSFPNQEAGLPECPNVLKFGDRYYIFVSVAYQTDHQVGPLQYYTGDAGMDLANVDWGNKTFSFLDGEDLVAAQVFPIGDKAYMYGWIPRTYNTMPWAPWGGYKNLPREVVIHRDGSLGGRIDPELARRLNKGRLFSLEQGLPEASNGQFTFDGKSYVATANMSVAYLNGNYSRSYLEGAFKLSGPSSAGIVFRQGNKTYRVGVETVEGKKFMFVRSPEDLNHVKNSRIEIKSDIDYINFKLVNEGEFIEFSINEEYALTAHTAMNLEPAEIGFYSDSVGTILDSLYVGKLAGRLDIHD